MTAPVTPMATKPITDSERQTLNNAMAIIQAWTPGGACWMIHPRNDWNTVTYFDSCGFQHPDLQLMGGTFADAIEAGIQREAGVPTHEAIKAERIARLRHQLAELTGEPA